MAQRQIYDVNAEWDDPFERTTERRASSRYKSKFKISLSVDDPEKGRLVGPALARDISVHGAKVITKHKLQAGQSVTVAIPTDLCPASMGLPKAFMGTGEVIRAEASDERKMLAAISFGDTFTGNMEFAVFVEYLRSISAVLSS